MEKCFELGSGLQRKIIKIEPNNPPKNIKKIRQNYRN